MSVFDDYGDNIASVRTSDAESLSGNHSDAACGDAALDVQCARGATWGSGLVAGRALRMAPSLPSAMVRMRCPSSRRMMRRLTSSPWTW